MMGRCNVFDFSLRFMLAAMWNNDSRWDMSQLDHAGLAGISPAGAVTFLDNRLHHRGSQAAQRIRPTGRYPPKLTRSPTIPTPICRFR
jgi:hypothetical protein